MSFSTFNFNYPRLQRKTIERNSFFFCHQYWPQFMVGSDWEDMDLRGRIRCQARLSRPLSSFQEFQEPSIRFTTCTRQQCSFLSIFSDEEDDDAMIFKIRKGNKAPPKGNSAAWTPAALKLWPAFGNEVRNYRQKANFPIWRNPSHCYLLFLFLTRSQGRLRTLIRIW